MSKRWRAQAILNFLSLDVHSRRFKSYLKLQNPSKNHANRMILVEFEQSPDNVIALAQFLPSLREKYKANTFSYLMRPKSKFPNHLNLLRYRMSTSNLVVGGNLRTLLYSYDEAIAKFPQILTILDSINSARDLVQLRIDGIEIGDLIYDKYLAWEQAPTINVQSARFREISVECLFYFYSWKRLLRQLDVAAICISHSVYHFAIPSRIAISKKIDVYQVSTDGIYRLDGTHLMALKEEINFPKEFDKLSPNEKAAGIQTAREKLQKRFTGHLSADLPYMSKSAFVESNGSLPPKSFPGQTVFVVAAHDFYDSPHVFGQNFYPDFYLWIKRLGELSAETDYVWLVKTHPYLRGAGREILLDLCNEFPRLTLLPQDMGHLDLLKYGISAVLTVYGTVASEYACFGIPTINASRNNPHVAYNFSFTPKDLEEYEDLILNFRNRPLNLDYEKVYEYYFMKHLRYRKSWVFNSYDDYVNDTQFGITGMDRSVYSYFLSKKNNLAQETYIAELREYLSGKEYKFQLKSNL
jgi:hypothetical protein